MLKNKKNIAVLGSTGSIGTQTLSVISKFPKLFKAYLLSANNNHVLLLKQAVYFKPKHIVINSEEGYLFLKERLKKQATKVWLRKDALCQLVTDKNIDLVLTAIVGSAGLMPTISAINAKKIIALANKETLVVAGSLIMALAKKKGVSIVPVDSEHSAIFQCLVGEDYKSIQKIILTASGGPFFNYSAKEFKNISVERALKHPNWEMGAKITIDSATLMNKAIEIIEASIIFRFPSDRIYPIIDKSSQIHSIIEYNDGNFTFSASINDMKVPINYALNYPDRVKTKTYANFNLYNRIELKKINENKHKAFKLCRLALKKGESSMAVLNAANNTLEGIKTYS